MSNKEMLSKNFSVEEMRCEDNCEEAKYPQMSIVILLELVRERFSNVYDAQCRVDVKDGCRCTNQNETTQKKWHPINNGGKEYVPFSSKSEHMNLHAADFKVFFRAETIIRGVRRYGWSQVPSKEVYDYLDSLFPNSLGLGLYHNRNHADCRKKRARW